MDADINKVCEALFNVGSVSDETQTFKEHPRYAQFKPKVTAASQNKRREEFLEQQKSKRFDVVSQIRNLAEGTITRLPAHESMEFQDSSRKPKRIYKDQLMLSEWLVDLPEDFSNNYLMVPCPLGKRALIVASKGQMRLYGRNGFCFEEGFSLLPGARKEFKHDYTILDGVINGDTIYVLDVLCWKKDTYVDCDTVFRFYWLHEKLEEIPELATKSNENKFRIVPLPNYPCDTESISNVLTSPLPFDVKLDGVLFYHKEAHYTPGICPLICWLKGYMVPDIIPGARVSEELAAEGRNKKIRKPEAMDAAETPAS